jgi:L-aminopeptidase/D-esterase-like protein
VARGGPVPRPLVWAGVGAVAAGLALGMTSAGRRAPVASRPPQPELTPSASGLG